MFYVPSPSSHTFSVAFHSDVSESVALQITLLTVFPKFHSDLCAAEKGLATLCDGPWPMLLSHEPAMSPPGSAGCPALAHVRWRFAVRPSSPVSPWACQTAFPLSVETVPCLFVPLGRKTSACEKALQSEVCTFDRNIVVCDCVCGCESVWSVK